MQGGRDSALIKRKVRVAHGSARARMRQQEDQTNEKEKLLTAPRARRCETNSMPFLRSVSMMTATLVPD
jgi:hypothetical protein